MADLILDGHTHAFPDAIAPGAMQMLTASARWMPVCPAHDGTLAGLLAAMDRAGIRRAIMCSVATRPGQVRKITDWSASVTCERIIAFASVHPDFEQPEAEIERLASLGVKGLKFHPQYMNCPADDPRVLRILRAAVKANLAVEFHAGYDLSFDRDDLASPPRLRRVYEAVPGLRLLCCHLGGWQCWEESLRLLAGLPVYLETSYCLGQCPRPLLDQFLERHPPQYLVFGSDSPWADQTKELAMFRALPLSAPAQRLALWDNGLRFAGAAG